MNLLMLSFPLNIFMAFLVLVALMPLLVQTFEQVIDAGFIGLNEILKANGGEDLMELHVYEPDLRRPGLKERFLHSDTRFPMDLQWFAPEDEGRTEDPTEYKLRKAPRRGEGRQIGRSYLGYNPDLLHYGTCSLRFRNSRGDAGYDDLFLFQLDQAGPGGISRDGDCRP